MNKLFFITTFFLISSLNAFQTMSNESKYEKLRSTIEESFFTWREEFSELNFEYPGYNKDTDPRFQYVSGQLDAYNSLLKIVDELESK